MLNTKTIYSPFLLLTILTFCCFAVTCVLAAAPCGEGELRLDAVTVPYIYGPLKNKFAVTGCFPSTDIDDYNVLLTELYSCTVLSVSRTQLDCMTKEIYDTVLQTDVTVTYTEAGEEDQAVLSDALDIYNPIGNYLVPLRNPAHAAQASFRLVIDDLPPTSTFQLALGPHGEVELEVESRKNNFFLLKLKSTAPAQDLVGKFHDVVIRDMTPHTAGLEVVRLSQAIYFFDPAEEDAYVYHTSPTWVTEGGDHDHTVIAQGQGLAAVTHMAIYHPITQEPLYIPRKAKETAQDAATFDIPPFLFNDTKTFPKFNTTKLINEDGDVVIPIPHGPQQYDLVVKSDASEKVEVVASAEITILRCPAPRFFLPSTHVPVNYAYDNTTTDYHVDMVEYIYDYPFEVPTRLKLSEKMILLLREPHLKPEVGFFQIGVEEGVVRFPLPPCGPEQGCAEYPSTAKACLISEISETCLVDLGSFTYDLPVPKQVVTFTKVHPFDGHFDNFEFFVNVYGWAWPTNPQTGELSKEFMQKVFLYNNATKTVIWPSWSVIDRHNLRAFLPRRCETPGVCPEGWYTPVLLKTYYTDHDYVIDPDTFTLPDITSVQLTFNPGQSWRIGVILKEQYNPDYQHIVLQNVLNAINVNAPFRVNNIKNITAPGPLYYDENGKPWNTTIAYIVTRPPYSDDDPSTAEDFKETILQQLEEGFYNDRLPNLIVPNKEVRHTAEEVYYCKWTYVYDAKDNCKAPTPPPNPSPDDTTKTTHGLLIGVIIVLVLLIPVVGFAVWKRQQMKIGVNDSMLINEHGEESYQKLE